MTAANGIKRPIRLNKGTCQFAYESLNHRYGLDTRQTPAISLDHLANYEAMSPFLRYAPPLPKLLFYCSIVRAWSSFPITLMAALDMDNTTLPIPSKLSDAESGISILPTLKNSIKIDNYNFNICGYTVTVIPRRCKSFCICY